jgi:hypothetical protein
MRPAISYLLPYRLFTEDKEHLEANVVKQTKMVVGSENLDELFGRHAYRVTLDVIYNKPVNLTLSATQLTKYLKPVFPNAKCVSVDQAYTATKSKNSLPIINFKIYF